MKLIGYGLGCKAAFTITGDNAHTNVLVQGLACNRCSKCVSCDYDFNFPREVELNSLGVCKVTEYDKSLGSLDGSKSIVCSHLGRNPWSG